MTIPPPFEIVTPLAVVVRGCVTEVTAPVPLTRTKSVQVVGWTESGLGVRAERSHWDQSFQSPSPPAQLMT